MPCIKLNLCKRILITLVAFVVNVAFRDLWLDGVTIASFVSTATFCNYSNKWDLMFAQIDINVISCFTFVWHSGIKTCPTLISSDTESLQNYQCNFMQCPWIKNDHVPRPPCLICGPSSKIFSLGL